jgi:hypothetical protein
MNRDLNWVTNFIFHVGDHREYTTAHLARRWALNRIDLILGIVAAAVGTAIAVYLLLTSGPASANGSIAAALFSAWVAACVGGVVKITSTRRGLISLFSSEIRAIQFGLVTMQMFEFWCSLHANPLQDPIGFAETKPKEDYFTVFHSVANNMGNLHPTAVEAVVRFYTYFKMSRDAAAGLASWEKIKDGEIRKINVEAVIKLLSISMLWGFVALEAMGAKAQRHDNDLYERMTHCYDSAVGKGALMQLVKATQGGMHFLRTCSRRAAPATSPMRTT